MPDFNKVLTPGDVENGEINTVIEIPKWSTLKIEWNRQVAAFELDRVEPSIFAKPTNYGFIPQTLDEDGDELDTLILTNDPLPTGIFLKAKVIGILNFEDDGEAAGLRAADAAVDGRAAADAEDDVADPDF